MVFCCLRFPPKKERKQVNLRYYSSKVEFLCSFIGGHQRHQKPFRNYLTFRVKNHFSARYSKNSLTLFFEIFIFWDFTFKFHMKFKSRISKNKVNEFLDYLAFLNLFSIKYSLCRHRDLRLNEWSQMICHLFPLLHSYEALLSYGHS